MARVKSQPILLVSILDPTGQEGIVKGALILERLHKATITVCTAIANQNDIEVDTITWLSFEEIKRQLNAIGRRYWIDWSIINGVTDLNIVSSIVQYLQVSRPGIKIIWAPAWDKDENGNALNKQEKVLFDEICQSVFLTVCSDKMISSLSNSERSTSFIPQSTLLITNGPGGAHWLWNKETSTQIPSNASIPHDSVGTTSFLVALGAFLHEGLELEDACPRALDFCESYPIN